MGRSHRTYTRRGRLMAGVFAVLAVLAGPTGTAIAHPLGNFTINHYASVRIEPDRILLDVVIDEAEIPAFQSRQAIDTDEDGETSEAELAAGGLQACQDLAGDLQLESDGGSALPLTLQEVGLSFPLGASGLSTLRLVCVYRATLPESIAAGPTRIAFADTSRPDRLGWREVVVIGDRVAVAPVAGELRSTSPSGRLTVYPGELLARPLADTRVVVDAVADPSVTAPAFDVPDAVRVQAAAPSSGPEPSPSDGAGPSPSEPTPSATPSTVGAVPGGIGGELPMIFSTADLTPLVLLISIITAAALGAGHALTPGHGKTLMAAYLVGTRGTAVHALGLGLSVSLSHTVGILALAAVVVGAADVLPPDLVVRIAPVIAALSILGIGAWMLVQEWRRRRSLRHAPLQVGHEHDTDHPHDHDHPHPHPHDHPHAQDHPHPPDHAHGSEDGDGDGDGALAGDAAAAAAGSHSHGGVRHSHLPATGTSITWRSLFVLGLAGGLIPSTSALLILLGSIAAGRPAFGFVLVVAFGFGMAAVMAGIGLVMVVARGQLDRLPGGGSLGRLRDTVPLAAAVLVFGFGVYLTSQALAGTLTL